MEQTIDLEIPLLLPGIENEKDECLVRLETSLQNYKGIIRAHVERDKSPVDLCLHYDPNLLTLSDVKRLADTLRQEAAPTMKVLKKMGVEHTIMLTGDNVRSASAIAAQVGLTEYRADLMPEDKLIVIRDLVKQYGQVAMIGDGVNDAPALANATVGIAMGGAGTDVALETADVALMGDDLSKLPFAVGLGRATRAIIMQNLFISLGVIALLIVTSLTGIVSIGIAVIFHEGSTLVVVANALRLLGYQDQKG